MEEEISLRELIETLIKRKNIIIYITLFAVVVSGLVSFLVLDPIYESSILLMASNGVEAQVPTGNGNVDDMLNSISQTPSMDIETYRQQIKRAGVMNKTIEDLNLGDEYTVESLAARIDLETIKDTKLIKIKMESSDPEKAAAIVNKVGENFITVATAKEKERITKTSQYINSQMEIEKSKYDEYLLEQKEILSKPRGATEVGLELNAKLGQTTGFKTQLNELEVKKDSLEEAIAMLASVGNINTTKIKGNGSNSTSSSSYLDSMNIISGDSGKLLKIELAEVQGMATSIERKIGEMQTDIEELQVELQDKSYKESIVNQKVNIAKQTYESFVKKYEELRVTESSKIGDASITIISRAHVSSRPIGPRKALNLAIALVLGLMLGVFIAFFVQYWKESDTGNSK